MRTGLTEQLDKWSILDELDELEEEWAMHEYVSHKYVKPPALAEWNLWKFHLVKFV